MEELGEARWVSPGSSSLLGTGSWRLKVEAELPAVALEGMTKTIILPEHPEALRPDLHWLHDVRAGRAVARVRQGGTVLAQAVLDRERREVLLWAHPGVASRDLRQFHASALLPAMARLQGDLVVHAAALEGEARSWLITAASGGGKSTTALLLAAAAPGWRLLADDAVALREEAGRWSLYAGPARLKAEGGTLELARRCGASIGAPVFTLGDKRFVELPEAPEPLRARPPGTLLVLERAVAGEGPGLWAVTGAEALALLRASRSLPFLETPTQATNELSSLARLLQSGTLTLLRVRVPEGLEAARGWVLSELLPRLRA